MGNKRVKIWEKICPLQYPVQLKLWLISRLCCHRYYKEEKNYWFWILWIWIKVITLRRKMINMIMNKLLPKNMCIKRKWDKFKTFLIIYTLSWNKKLLCDHGLLSSYRSLHSLLLQMSSHNHECKRLYVTTHCIKIAII